jgi:hypothetical protein
MKELMLGIALGAIAIYFAFKDIFDVKSYEITSSQEKDVRRRAPTIVSTPTATPSIAPPSIPSAFQTPATGGTIPNASIIIGNQDSGGGQQGGQQLIPGNPDYNLQQLFELAEEDARPQSRARRQALIQQMSKRSLGIGGSASPTVSRSIPVFSNPRPPSSITSTSPYTIPMEDISVTDESQSGDESVIEAI